MKMLINCPLCNHILITDYQYFLKNQTACYKYCMGYSHYFKEVSYINNHDEVRHLTLKLDAAFIKPNTPYWRWDFDSKKLSVNYEEILTFFYPDFSDLNKLKNKLKICIAFS